MAFAPPKNSEGPKMQTKMSAWTPLNHQLMNDKVFEERRILLGKWVSWHWKYLTELDPLWMRKCLRFGWYINFSPTPFEQGIWKRHYIEMVKEFLVTRPTTIPKHDFVVFDVQPVAKETSEVEQSLSSILQLGKKVDKEKRGLPPWRSSDKHPMDIIRFNYLDNYDPIEQARQLSRKKGGGLTPDISQQAFQKKRKPSSATYKLRKAKSLMSLSADFDAHPKIPVRPSWATHQSTGYPVTKTTAKLLAQSAQWNAGIRPAPIRGSVPKLSKKGMKAFARTTRSSPTSPLFESQPWEVPPSSHVSDSD
ncbi:F-box only protein 16 isoform X4 [Paroedura picta]|uniref:F-box only protein 16 isoform X4 n=1 Tax=Paroedura picta TaxID=143630 RepID=UPI004057738C